MVRSLAFTLYRCEPVPGGIGAGRPHPGQLGAFGGITAPQLAQRRRMEPEVMRPHLLHHVHSLHQPTPGMEAP